MLRMYSTTSLDSFQEASTDAEIARLLEELPCLHIELFGELSQHPAFGPLSAAMLGRTLSRAGVAPSDPYFQEYVPSLPLLARVACELAIFWWFSEGKSDENHSAYAALCQQVAADEVLEDALEVLRDARLSDRIVGRDYAARQNEMVEHLCKVALALEDPLKV